MVNINLNINNESPNFYSYHGCITDPGQYSELLDGLPNDIPDLVNIVQGLILHIHLTEKYGIQPPEERRHEANLRFVHKQLEQIKKLDMSTLNISRPLEKRLLGTCRDFSVFLCALLRQQGIPARARCGFGTYFTPGLNEDHWICEYWKEDEQRWVMVDAQLDRLQCQVLEIDFDPLDMPAGLFLTGGKAWQMCRLEDADPDKFGIFDMHGLWFIRGNVIRDMASLNKMELLPWDCWGLIEEDFETHSDEDLALLDRVASLTLSNELSISNLRSMYEENKGIRVSPVISSFIGAVAAGSEFQKINITEDCASIFL